MSPHPKITLQPVTLTISGHFLLMTLLTFAACSDASSVKGAPGDEALDSDAGSENIPSDAAMRDDDAQTDDPQARLDASDDAASATDSSTTTPSDGRDVEPDLPSGDPDGGDPATGSWSSPIIIDALPFTDSRDTRQAASTQVDVYTPCAPDIDEGGGEFVYVVTAPEAGTLTASINELPGDGVDIDVHILDAPDPTSCRARGHIEASVTVRAQQRLWIVADTWVDGEGVAQAGPYTLSVRLRTDDPDPDPDPDPGDPRDCLSRPIACEDGQAPAPVNLPQESAGDPGCPSGMARVADFCVDRHEASLMQVLDDNTLTPWSPYLNPGQVRVRAWSAAGVVPQGYITQVQAAQACQEAGKRLCTDTEWLRACQGAQGHTYPYGDPFQAGACNTVRACHPVVQYFESGQSWVWSRLDHPCINQMPEGLALTGEYDACVTQEGVYDMSGNLHEWTANPTGIFRGGFYVDAVINGPGCLYRTTAHNTVHWDYSTGFRCCADAQ